MNNGRSPLGLYPFLRPLLALITGIVVGESRLVAIPMLYGGLLLAFCLLVLCLVYTVSDHYRTVWTGTLILLFFVVCGYLMASQAMQRTDYPFQRDETVCRVTVREVPEARPRSLYCPGDAASRFCKRGAYFLVLFRSRFGRPHFVQGG